MKAKFDALKKQAGQLPAGFTPAKVGAAVTKKGDYTVYVIVITNE